MTAPTAVLGASGQIGTLVLDALAAAGRPAVAVGRTVPVAPPTSTTVRRVAGYGRDELAAALAGCADVVATLGLPYSTRTWERAWVPLVAAVADTCAALRLPLTFLDNVYPYGAGRGVLTEATPYAPCSRKGAVRLAGWHELDRRADAGLDVVVCRAADFVGPRADTTVLPWQDVARVARGERHSLPWLGSPVAQHTFALTTQVATALVRVAHDPAMRGHRVLHLPVVEPFSGRTLAAALARARPAERPVRLRVLRAPAVRAAALVSPRAREQAEMMYQVEQDQLVGDGLVRSLGWSTPPATVHDVVRLALDRAGAGISSA